MESMGLDSSFKPNRLAAKDRIKPKLYHSRYVHLRSLYKSLCETVSKHLDRKKDYIIADFGCGEIPYYHLLKPYSREYLAIDIEGNNKASHTIDLETNKCNIDEEYCDLVWSIQVLEHVENYQLYLREAFRILKKEGLMIATTHGSWKYHPDPIDFWRWTSEGLKHTFEANGFKVIDFKGSLSYLSTTILLFQDACMLSFPLTRFWSKPFCLMIQITLLITEWFSRKSKTLNAHRNLDSDIYVVVAKKM